MKIWGMTMCQLAIKDAVRLYDFPVFVINYVVLFIVGCCAIVGVDVKKKIGVDVKKKKKLQCLKKINK